MGAGIGLCTLVRHNSLHRGGLLRPNSVLFVPHGSSLGIFIVNRINGRDALGVSHDNVALTRTLNGTRNVGRSITSTAKVFIVHTARGGRGNGVTGVCRLGTGSTSTVVLKARFRLRPCSVICIAATPLTH